MSTLQNLRSYYGITAPVQTQDEDDVVYRRALPRFAELFDVTTIDGSEALPSTLLGLMRGNIHQIPKDLLPHSLV